MKYLMIFIILVIFIIPISNVFAQSDITNSEITDSDYILTLNTENSKYIPGQIPIIFGTVYNVGNSTSDNIQIIIVITDSKDNPVYESKIRPVDGKFRLVSFSPEETGKYNIRAFIENKIEGSTEILVKNYYETLFGYGSIAILVSISLLLFIIALPLERIPITTSEPIRFALLTLCTLLPIITLIVTDVQIGQDGVAGLVLQEIPPNTQSLNNLIDPSSLSLGASDIRHFK